MNLPAHIQQMQNQYRAFETALYNTKIRLNELERDVQLITDAVAVKIVKQRIVLLRYEILVHKRNMYVLDGEITNALCNSFLLPQGIPVAPVLLNEPKQPVPLYCLPLPALKDFKAKNS
jgi:hypothetical protein